VLLAVDRGRITGNPEVISEQIIASGWPTTRAPVNNQVSKKSPGAR
jgi:hypothetical protein